MIRGRFGDTSGRPFISGRLIIKDLQVISFVSFCLDTGSDETVILPADGRRFSLDYGKLTGGIESCSLNGNCKLFPVPATVQFFEPDYDHPETIHSYDITIKIAPNRDDLMQLPSILGRNVFDNWSINYCRHKNRLTIKVLSADRTVTYMATP